jgi:hypothetical protein
MWSLKALDPRVWTSGRRETFSGAFVLFVLINITLLPFVWGHSTLEDSEFVPSLYSTGSRYPALSAPVVNRVLDPGAPAWQTEPEFTLERRLLTREKAPPLWNPYAAYGTPLAANMQSQPYSPFAWVRLAWPSPRGYDVFVMLRLYVAGLGAFLFLRQFTGTLPALAGGVSYMYAGYFWLYVTMPEISTEAMLSVVLYAFERLLRRPGLPTALALAVAIAVSIFGGMPEAALLLLTLAYLYAAVRVLADVEVRAGLRRVAASAAAATVLGLALSAIVTLPFLQYVGDSFNTHSGVAAPMGLAVDGFSSSSLVQYLAPLIDGGPYNDIFSNFSGYSGIRGFVGVSIAFFGLVAIFGQIEASFRGRKRAEPIFFFGSVMLVMLLKRWGFPAVNWLGTLPGFRLVNFPKYEENLIALCAAVLGAFGVAALCERRASGATVWAAAAVPLTILAVASYDDRAALGALTSHREFYVNAMRGALVSLGSVASLAYFARRGMSSRVAGCAAVAFVFAELNGAYIYPLYYGVNGRAPQSATAQNGAPFVTYLQRHLTGGNRFFAEDDILYPNWSSAFQIADIRSLDALYQKRYLAFVATFLPPGSGEDLSDRFVGTETGGLRSAALRRLLQLSSVEYVGLLHPLATAATAQPFALAYAEPGVTLYHVANALPRISGYARVVLARDGEGARAAIAAPGFDPEREVVVEGDGPALRALAGRPGRRRTEGRLETYRSLYARASFEGPSPAFVMFNDTMFPGWHARVDGRAANIYTANYLFRGVLVGAGHHVLEFSYSPASYVAGLAITSVALVVVGAGIVVVVRRRARPAVAR